MGELLIFCHCKLIYSMGPPLSPRAVHASCALWGRDVPVSFAVPPFCPSHGSPFTTSASVPSPTTLLSFSLSFFLSFFLSIRARAHTLPAFGAQPSTHVGLATTCHRSYPAVPRCAEPLLRPLFATRRKRHLALSLPLPLPFLFSFSFLRDHRRPRRKIHSRFVAPRLCVLLVASEIRSFK